MRMSTLRRGVVLVAGVLGLLATAAPPASATTIVSVVFQGTATLSGPLGFPCVGPGGTPDASNKCPIIDTTDTAQIDITSTTNVTVPIGGNTRSFVFSSGPCVGLGVNVNKPKPDPVVVGTCTIAAAGTVTGHCGLSIGRGTATVTVSNVVPPATKTVTGGFQFVGVGGTLVILPRPLINTSTAISGVVEAIPVPVPTVEPLGIDNSCARKTARVFLIAGSASAVDIT